MEEELKILEDETSALGLFFKCKGTGTYKRAIENLLTRYKQLEEENRILKRANSIAEDVSIEDITQVMNKAYKDFMKEFIPTSLVKEKIEELKGTEELLSDEQGYWGGSDLLAKIEVLQDLLERSREYV